MAKQSYTLWIWYRISGKPIDFPFFAPYNLAGAGAASHHFCSVNARKEIIISQSECSICGFSKLQANHVSKEFFGCFNCKIYWG